MQHCVMKITLDQIKVRDLLKMKDVTYRLIVSVVQIVKLYQT